MEFVLYLYRLPLILKSLKTHIIFFIVLNNVARCPGLAVCEVLVGESINSQEAYNTTVLVSLNIQRNILECQDFLKTWETNEEIQK